MNRPLYIFALGQSVADGGVGSIVVENSKDIDVSTVRDLSIHVYGMAVDTVQIFASNEEGTPDAFPGNWAQVGVDITADGFLAIENGAMWLLIRHSVASGGGVFAILTGRIET